MNVKPTHIVVPFDGYVLAGCPADDAERTEAILKAGFTRTEVSPDITLPGWHYFTRSAETEPELN